MVQFEPFSISSQITHCIHFMESAFISLTSETIKSTLVV